METIRPMIPYLVPIVILEVALAVFALRDLSRRERTNGPKWLWVLIIVLIQIIGPLSYFVAGRRDE